MSTKDPIVKILISAYRRGKAVLAEREQAQRAQQSTPTETKVAGDDGDFGARNTDDGNQSEYYHKS